MANVGATGSTYMPLRGGQQGGPPQAEQTILQQLAGSVAPQTAQAQLQYNLGQQQLGMVGPEANLQMAYNQAMSGYQAQNLGLSEQGLALQGTGLNQQQAQQQAQQQFEQQQYGIQQGQYPEQQAEAALAYQNALMNTQGQQAIGGTQNTVGGRAAISTLGQQYGFQQQDIARQQALSQLGQKSELSQYGYSQQQIANARANLALSARANGLSEQQMLTMLQYGQQQVGIGAQQDIIQLLAGQGQNALGQISTMGSTLSAIGFAGGANALAGIGG